MALADLVPHPELISPWFVTAAVITVVVGVASVLLKDYSIPEKAPKLASGLWPILGHRGFFNARWDFHRTHGHASPTGNWTYFVGRKPVIGMSGDASRKLYFGSNKLNLSAGYSGLFAGSPDTPTSDEDRTTRGEGHDAHFFKRLVHVTRREKLAQGKSLRICAVYPKGLTHAVVPGMIKSLRADLDELATRENKVIKPFDTIYDYLFRMIVRVVGCNELVNDDVARAKVLKNFHMIEDAGTPFTIMYPKIPTIAFLKRMWGGAQIWMIFDKYIKERKKTGRKEDDPLQYLMESGDDTTQIISVSPPLLTHLVRILTSSKFVIGALYAGQLNSGINATWIISFLSNNPEWHKNVYNEVHRVVDKHVPDRSSSLADRLSLLPFDAWESEFTIIDACLRETIRITTPGSVFRQNTTPDPIPINDKEVIPPGFYATYAVSDIHLDESVYPDPRTFNPGRYVNADGTEAADFQGVNDPNSPKNFAFVGWGAGSYPCLGMRFAKLEMYLITAFWVAYFDMQVVEPKGRLPSLEPILNLHCASKPKEEVLLRYWPRGEAEPVA